MGKRGPAAKLVARLSSAERTDLEEMILKRIGAAYRLLKARILLKADVSEAVEPSPSYSSAHPPTACRGRPGGVFVAQEKDPTHLRVYLTGQQRQD